MIINRYIKILYYLLIKKDFKVINLINILFKEDFLKYNTPNNIILN